MNRLRLAALATGVLLVASCEAERAPAEKASDVKNPVVIMDTSKGTIKIELNAAQAPATVENFLGYVDAKFYDGTVFHRVKKGFMIQGGGFEAPLKNVKNVAEFQAKEKKTRDPIRNEASNGLSNLRGTIAMARTNNPDSATSQFFINVVDNTFLDRSPQSPGYCVFGKVIDGMDVVDEIRSVETRTIGRQIEDVPVEDVIIKSVRRAEK